MEPNYTWERLFKAVFNLVSSGTIQCRLYYAYDSLNTLRVEDFPEKLQEDFQKIKINNRGIIKEDIENMSEEEANEIAEKILSLYDKVSRRRGAFDYLDHQKYGDLYDYLEDIKELYHQT